MAWSHLCEYTNTVLIFTDIKLHWVGEGKIGVRQIDILSLNVIDIHEDHKKEIRAENNREIRITRCGAYTESRSERGFLMPEVLGSRGK